MSRHLDRWRQPKSLTKPAAPSSRASSQATLTRALDENDKYVQREREKLGHWADDQVLAAEQVLEDTKRRGCIARRGGSPHSHRFPST